MHLRSMLQRELRPLGLACASAATHPFTVWQETVVSTGPRYELVYGSMRELARREPTFALHVHVGVDDPEDAIRLTNRMRAHLPLLLALSVNSPFWQGRDTGLGSARTPLFQAFPRVGIPRVFARLRRLGRGGRPADPLRRVPRAHLPLVGRAPPAALRHGGGADPRRPDHGGRDRGAGGARAVDRAAGGAGGLRVRAAGATPRRRWTRTASSRRATAWRATLIDPDRECRVPAPRAARRRCWRPCRRTRAELGCEAELEPIAAMAKRTGALPPARLRPPGRRAARAGRGAGRTRSASRGMLSRMLRPVPSRPPGPVDPAEARAFVAASLPSLDEAAAVGVLLVVLGGQPRSAVPGLSAEEVSVALTRARKEVRRASWPLAGLGLVRARGAADLRPARRLLWTTPGCSTRTWRTASAAWSTSGGWCRRRTRWWRRSPRRMPSRSPIAVACARAAGTEGDRAAGGGASRRGAGAGAAARAPRSAAGLAWGALAVLAVLLTLAAIAVAMAGALGAGLLALPGQHRLDRGHEPVRRPPRPPASASARRRRGPGRRPGPSS